MKTWLGISGSLYDWINLIPWKWGAILLLVIALLWLIYKKGHIVVPENKVAVVSRTENQVFLRLLQTGRHWINPAREYIRAIISTGPIEIEGCCEPQTWDGNLVTLEWKLTYRLELLNSDPYYGEEEICLIVNRAREKVFTYTSENTCLLLGHYLSSSLLNGCIQERIQRQLAKLVAEQVYPYGALVEAVEIKVRPKVEPKQLAQIVRSIRLNRGDLSREEIEQLTQLDVSAAPQLETAAGVRPAVPKSEYSTESNYPEMYLHSTLHNVDYSSDGSIGKIVV